MDTKTALHTTLTLGVLYVLAGYGYAHSMTAQGFPIQGALGTAIPLALGAMLYALGVIHGTSTATR